MLTLVLSSKTPAMTGKDQQQQTTSGSFLKTLHLAMEGGMLESDRMSH